MLFELEVEVLKFCVYCDFCSSATLQHLYVQRKNFSATNESVKKNLNFAVRVDVVRGFSAWCRAIYKIRCNGKEILATF